MKKVIFMLSLLLTVTLQAQIIDTASEVAHIDENQLKETPVKKISKLQHIERELEALRKENIQLKQVINTHHNCLKNNPNDHSELAELNAINARRQPKKIQRSQSILPPPL